jgi:hypothetical protein
VRGTVILAKNRFKRKNVAVDISEDRNTHGSTFTRGLPIAAAQIAASDRPGLILCSSMAAAIALPGALKRSPAAKAARPPKVLARHFRMPVPCFVNVILRHGGTLLGEYKTCGCAPGGDDA